MACRKFPRRNERGFTYLMLMFAIVVMGIGVTTAARSWKVMVQRELEADLLAKGIEIQQALALYSTTMKAGRVVPGEVYPQSLADLTRLPKPFLRKVYSDPMSHGEWEILRSPTGGIMGVRSKSKAKPIRLNEFPPQVRHFEGRRTYYDWVFQHPNPSSGSFVAPGGATTTPTGQPFAPGAPPQPQAGTMTAPNQPPQPAPLP